MQCLMKFVVMSQNCRKFQSLEDYDSQKKSFHSQELNFITDETFSDIEKINELDLNEKINVSFCFLFFEKLYYQKKYDLCLKIVEIVQKKIQCINDQNKCETNKKFLMNLNYYKKKCNEKL